MVLIMHESPQGSIGVFEHTMIVASDLIIGSLALAIQQDMLLRDLCLNGASQGEQCYSYTSMVLVMHKSPQGSIGVFEQTMIAASDLIIGRLSKNKMLL
jgi:hypothetical protein